MTCRDCQRIVRAEHVDGEGRCIFCSPPASWPMRWTKPEPREVRA